MPVAANVTSAFPTYTITVNDVGISLFDIRCAIAAYLYIYPQTAPVWVYCKQAANLPASHCGAGMVFAVNCGADGSPNSFTNFKNSALQVGASLSAAATATPPSTVATAAYGGVTIPPAVCTCP